MTQHTFTVWAPDAGSVDLVLAEARTSMDRARGGWWTRTVTLGDGPCDYAFSLDGGDPRPDPRSLSQPHGVHAASRLVDTQAHDWGDGSWKGRDLAGSVIYELHVGTFTPEGTLDAAAERLDDLAALGVTTVELMPLAAFPGDRGWGYDGVCLYAVHERYGGFAALQRFVDAAHQKGLAVWLDVVYNHLGPSGNYLSQFGPYFTDTHHTPWGQAVNLDAPASDEVRAYLLDNAALWLREAHLDGLRLDAVHALKDDRAITLLEELGALADAIAAETGIPRHLVAESDRNDPATVTPRDQGGLGLHGQWADDIHHGLHVAVTGERHGYYDDFADPAALPTLLTTPFWHADTWSSFRGRRHGRPVNTRTTPGWRFVASLQTHDQVGNRAAGDRISDTADPGRLAAGVALLLTSPYTPMLFMGEEWAASTPWQYFTHHAEPELARAIQEGRAAEFASHGWGGEVPDPQAESTVANSALRWDERAQPQHARVLAWYTDLLRLRRENADLADGDLSAVQSAREGDVISMVRGQFLVVAHLGSGPAAVAIPEGAEIVLTWDDDVNISATEAGAHLRFPGPGAAVVRAGAGTCGD